MNGDRLPLLLGVFLMCSASPGLAENLFTNPGFDRDLAGWITTSAPSSLATEGDLASVAWSASGASTAGLSGGLALHVLSSIGSGTASAGQCFVVDPGMLATAEARILTIRQYMTASASVNVTFFSSADCSGRPLAKGSGSTLPFVIPETDSAGRWLAAKARALASPGTHSVLAEISATAQGSWMYGTAEIVAIADDAVLTLTPAATTTWILPSAAWVNGAEGSHWITSFTLCNPGPVDAVVTFKWLGHDDDGRGGSERTWVVAAGRTLAPESEEWELNYTGNWGAILVTSSSPDLVVQSETSTYLSGGTVGHVVPVLGAADYASAVPKTLTPIREDDGWRTNLVLANPTELPLMVHVALFGADGSPLGERDVDLPPLGMTQINRVAAELGAPILHLGRISVSTPTPGGLVAAYASIIDNETNDPRTVLPR